MGSRILHRDDLLQILRRASEEQEVTVPALRGGLVLLEGLSPDSEPYLGRGVAARSPKVFFFPPSEVMLSYQRTDRGMELRDAAAPGKTPRLLFGIRPCAGRALRLLDRLFDSEDYRDPYYVARRKNTTLVAMACTEPLSTCFCTSTGGDPFATEGLDALVAEMGSDEFMVQSLSEKGEALFGAAGKEAGSSDVARVDELAESARKSMSPAVPVQQAAEQLDDAFESDLWDLFHEKCLGCAACAFLCPTCHCFNIIDENELTGGRRIRAWDCCMFPLFTKHVSGHNPRPSKRERMRQRIMHKFQYFAKNFGDVACVGCGRCVRGCPVNNDLREIIGTIAARTGARAAGQG